MTSYVNYDPRAFAKCQARAQRRAIMETPVSPAPRPIYDALTTAAALGLSFVAAVSVFGVAFYLA